MKELIKNRHESFMVAFAGVKWAVTTQPNFIIHLIIAIFVIGFGLYFRISRIEFIIILFIIILGLVAEMINTSIEAMTDLITTEWRQQAKIAKDVSAGMMLTVAVGAIIVGIMIFWPYLF